jgi:predicted nucleic acid-binding protein
LSGLIVDTSVTMALCFADEWEPAIDPVLRDVVAGRGAAPALWALETANVLELATRRRRLSIESATAFRRLFKQLCIRLIEIDKALALDGIAELARAHALTVYDAAYLHCALSSGLPLATRDRALARAAAAEGLQLLC